MFDNLNALTEMLVMGGPAIWAISILGALTAGIILWKIVRLSLQGAFSRRRADRAVTLWLDGNHAEARMQNGKGLRGRAVGTAFEVLGDPRLTDQTRREEIGRVANVSLTQARGGLRALELIATVAPLVGLLGTVMGMITAFQALEAAGSSADPSALAGGIWEALLTTAAGMGVAIPASAALTWFESIADRAQSDIEDLVTRLLVHGTATPPRPERVLQVAE